MAFEQSVPRSDHLSLTTAAAGTQHSTAAVVPSSAPSSVPSSTSPRPYMDSSSSRQSVSSAQTSPSPVPEVNGATNIPDAEISPASASSQALDVDPQILEALRSKDRIYVLKLGETFEALIKERRARVELTPATSYQRLLVHRCSAYYKLVPESDPVTKCLFVLPTSESKIPERRICELVPAESSTQPAFKIMRRSVADRRSKPQSHAGSVAGEDADLSDVEPSEAGSLGGRSNITSSSNKKRMTIEEREAAYNEARSRIFMGFEEKEKGKEKDMSASSSSLSISGSTSTSAGGRSSLGDTDDAASSPATESEWSTPSGSNPRDKKDGGRRGGSSSASSSRPLRSGGSFQGTGSGGSSRNSRAPSPSFTYASLYEPPASSQGYDPSQHHPGYHPGQYAYPYSPPSQGPSPPFLAPYPYYNQHHYPYQSPPPILQQHAAGDPSVPPGGAHEPYTSQHQHPVNMNYAPQYGWSPHPPQLSHPHPSQQPNMQSPTHPMHLGMASPPPHPQHQPQPQYQQPHNGSHPSQPPPPPHMSGPMPPHHGAGPPPSHSPPYQPYGMHHPPQHAYTYPPMNTYYPPPPPGPGAGSHVPNHSQHGSQGGPPHPPPPQGHPGMQQQQLHPGYDPRAMTAPPMGLLHGPDGPYSGPNVNINQHQILNGPPRHGLGNGVIHPNANSNSNGTGHGRSISGRTMSGGGLNNNVNGNGSNGSSQGGKGHMQVPPPQSTRAAWSYGPGVGIGGFPTSISSAGDGMGLSGMVGGGGVGPRFGSNSRRTSGHTSSGGNSRSSSNYDEVSSTASSSTNSSSSRRTFTSTTSSQHPLPARPDWAVGLKAQPTLTGGRTHRDDRDREHGHSHSHGHSLTNSRTISPISPPPRSNGQNSPHVGANSLNNTSVNSGHSPRQPVSPPSGLGAGSTPVSLHPTDFPPLTSAGLSVQEKKAPVVAGAWGASRPVLSPTTNGNVVGPGGQQSPSLKGQFQGPSGQRVSPGQGDKYKEAPASGAAALVGQVAMMSLATSGGLGEENLKDTGLGDAQPAVPLTAAVPVAPSSST